MSGSEACEEGKYRIRQIFLEAFDSYRDTHFLSQEQDAAGYCIMHCKTGKLGSNYYECSECGHVRVVPRSCGNRNCPSCQAVAKAAWLEERKGELIDAPYFHVVGTLPHELNPLIAANRKPLYELLHKSMGKALVELSNDPRYLGASPGIIQVLHTWDQQLRYHVHVHCVVSGGGLTSAGKLVTLPMDKPFFLPIKPLAALYRGKFMAGLKELRSSGKLETPADPGGLASPEGWQRFLDHLYGIDWNVYIKQTFNGNGNAIEYLSKYTNRIAISNSRIVSFTEEGVTFSYTDRKDGGRKKELTVTAHEFIRRFLQHVLPKGFQKIRYYGFLNNSRRKKNLEVIFSQQGGRKYIPKFNRSSPVVLITAEAWGFNPVKCPCCGKDAMEYLANSMEMETASSGMRPKPFSLRSPRARPA